MDVILSSILQNKILMISLLAWAIAQILKTMISYWILKEFSLERLLGAGGMPSSHSALVISLVTSVGLMEGLTSTYFAISTIFAGIVMYDATGVRQAAGKHAKAINQIVRQLRYEHKIDDISLKELLGHTPIEVIAGALLGFLVAYIYCQLILV